MSLNVKDILLLNTKSPGAVLTISRAKTTLPLKDISIVESNNLNEAHFKIGVSRVTNPLEFSYLPEIVDIYPIEENISPGVAMFCFPNGIRFKKANDLPKWFSFILTDELGNRSYASCLVFTEEVQSIVYSSVRI
jgi:hypothetical protein